MTNAGESKAIAGTIQVGWSIDERGLGVDHIQRELTKGELAALYDRIGDLVGPVNGLLSDLRNELGDECDV
jgi:hypothetical protein